MNRRLLALLALLLAMSLVVTACVPATGGTPPAGETAPAGVEATEPLASTEVPAEATAPAGAEATEPMAATEEATAADETVEATEPAMEETAEATESATGGTGAVTANEEYTLGLAVSTLNNPFFVTLVDGAEAAAEATGVQLTVVDAQDDPAQQASSIEDLIQSGVDALLVNPTDADAIVPSVQLANQAGIPVFTVDRAATAGEIVSHIASDNVAGGRMAAEFMCDALGGTGSVVELQGIAGTSAARDRGQGFNDYMASDCPDVTIVAQQTANFNRAEGLTVFENILQAEPEINGVFAHNDEMILGAIEAAEAAGRTEDIVFVGFDAIDDAVAAVEAGTLDATVAQQPEEMGRLAVETAVRSLNGDEVEESTAVELSLVTQ